MFIVICNSRVPHIRATPLGFIRSINSLPRVTRCFADAHIVPPWADIEPPLRGFSLPNDSSAMRHRMCIICFLFLLSVPTVSSGSQYECEVPVGCACDIQAECNCSICLSGQADDGDSWKFFGNCSCLNRWGITIGGHLQQGITTNSRNPMNPTAGVGNFPATQWNYRNDEYMLNLL